MARAMLAPVIGRPASSSQYIVWRYSSSATVACSWDTTSIVAPASGPPPVTAHQAAARALLQGAAGRRRVVLRAEVGRLSHDRVQGRQGRAAPEPQRQADEPLLPRRRRAGAGPVGPPAGDRRRDDRGGGRGAGVRPAVTADPPRGLARGDAG